MAESLTLGRKGEASTNDRAQFVSDLVRFVEMCLQDQAALAQPGAVVPIHLRELCAELHGRAVVLGYEAVKYQLERWSAMACQPAPVPVQGLRDVLCVLARLTLSARRTVHPISLLQADEKQSEGDDRPKVTADSKWRNAFRNWRPPESSSTTALVTTRNPSSAAIIVTFLGRVSSTAILPHRSDIDSTREPTPAGPRSTASHGQRAGTWLTLGILGLAAALVGALFWPGDAVKRDDTEPRPAASTPAALEAGVAYPLNPVAAPEAPAVADAKADVSPEFREYLEMLAKREREFCDTNPGDCRRDVAVPPIPPSPRISILEGLRMPPGIPVVQGDVLVQQWFSYYAEKAHGREQMQLNLFRCSAYREDIEAMLNRFGLPKALMAVVFIESGCDTSATSKAGAKGIWQFMPELAQAYRLHIMENVIDERLNPTKVTQVAVKFLADLYRQFGSWDLALAGYNLGPYGLMSRIRRWGAGATFAKLASAGWLPSETVDYVPHVQALAVILENLRALKFVNQVKTPIDTADLVVPAGTRLSMVARAAGTSTLRIHELNRDMLRATVPDLPGHYILQVPRNVQLRAQQALRELLESKGDEDRCVDVAFDWGKQLFTSQMKTKCDQVRVSRARAAHRP